MRPRSVTFALLFLAAFNQNVPAQERILRPRVHPNSGFDGVFAVAFSPDGRTLATVRGESVAAGSPQPPDLVTMWEATTGKERAIFRTHTDTIFSLAISPDGKTWTAGSLAEGSVKLWDMTTGKEVATLGKHTKGIYSLAFAPDGKTLASASYDKTVKLWDMSTRKERIILRGHQDIVLHVSFAPDGKSLATAGGDETVRLWDSATGRERASVKHEGLKRTVFSRDGSVIVSAGGEYDKYGEIRIWDPINGRLKASFKGHAEPIWSIAFGPDGKLLATGSDDGTVWLWDTATWKKRSAIQAHKNRVFSVAFSPDRKLLASAGGDGTAKLWNVASVLDQGPGK